MNNQHNQSNQKNRGSLHIYTKQTRNLTLVLCLGMLAGVLIWAKLRLVTDIPRSAYADPRELEVSEEQPEEQSDDQKVEDSSSDSIIVPDLVPIIKP